MDLHKALCLPGNLHIGGSQSAAPATKSAHGHSQNAVPAMEVHRGTQSLHLPQNLQMEVRNLHFKEQVKASIRMDRRFPARSQNDPRLSRIHLFANQPEEDKHNNPEPK